jgi:cytoskeletal protein CcmA (bactofilin family)
MPIVVTDEHGIKTCTMKDNFTFFSDIEFWNKTNFTNDSFVYFEKDVTFYDDVKFTSDVHFEDDVYISNDHKDVYFEVDGKVKVNFDPHYTIYVKKETEFSKDVRMKQNLRVYDELHVDGHTYLDETDIGGVLDVKDDAIVDGELYVDHGITAKGGITLKTGKLYVDKGGIEVTGHSTFHNDVLVKEDLTVLGNKLYSGDVEVQGLLTVKNGAVIYNGAEINDGSYARRSARHLVAGENALLVNGKATIAQEGNALVVDGKAVVGGMEITGEAGRKPALDVTGDAHFTGNVTAKNIPTKPPQTIIDIDIEELTLNIIVEISKRTIIFGNAFIESEESQNQVLTPSLLAGMTLDVDVINADTAITVGGEPVTGGDSAGGAMYTPGDVVAMLGSYRDGPVSIASILTEELQVESTAQVGGNDVLTTADAVVEATTVEGCGCTVDEISDAINGVSVTFDIVSANSYRIWDPSAGQYQTFGGGESESCTCSSTDVQNALADMTLGCGCDSNDIAAMGFITECSCPEPDCPCPDFQSFVDSLPECVCPEV